MGDRIFLDTNVLVYSRDSTEPAKNEVASGIVVELWRNRRGVISTQVCSEYYVCVTRKLDPGLPREEAWDDLESLFAWEPIPIDTRCLRVARQVEARYQLSWWDSTIVAAASVADCAEILSEDLSHGQVYLGMPVRNPFMA